MTTFTTFVSLTRLTAMLAAGTFLLTVADGASTMDGVVEVPAALNPDKLSIFRVVSAKGVQVYACTRNPAGATGWVRKTSPSASTMPDRPGKVSTAVRSSAR
jgi:hypothetical protein